MPHWKFAFLFRLVAISLGFLLLTLFGNLREWNSRLKGILVAVRTNSTTVIPLSMRSESAVPIRQQATATPLAGALFLYAVPPISPTRERAPARSSLDWRAAPTDGLSQSGTCRPFLASTTPVTQK